MSTTIGFGLIKAVIEEQVPLSQLAEEGITDKHFEGNERRAYDFVQKHYQKYNVLPKITTVAVEIERPTSFHALPEENFGYWLDRVKNRRRYYIAQSGMKRIDGMFEKAEVRRAIDHFGEVHSALQGTYGETRNLPEGFTAAELIVMDLPEIQWAVESILPEGASLLAGKPKTGKSILSLNIGIAVSRGDKALESFNVKSGSVIYLALEDTKARLQHRLITMLEGKPAPKNLHLYPEWSRMGQNGLTLLDQEIQKFGDVTLVIIDTLAKFRPVDSKKNQTHYERDYHDLSRIKALAEKYNLSALVVHHLRKMSAEDIFDTISGTLGLTGAVDSTLILTRSSRNTELHIDGRDVEKDEYALKFNPDNLSWKIIGKAHEVKSTDQKQRLYNALKEADNALSPKEIAGTTGLSSSYVRKTLPKLVEEGDITKIGYGKYIYRGNSGYTGYSRNTGNSGNSTSDTPDSCESVPEGYSTGNSCKAIDNNTLEASVPTVPTVLTDSCERYDIALETKGIT